MPLSICATTVSGLTTTPQSTAQATLWTRSALPSPTEVSTTSATIEPKDSCSARPRNRPGGGGDPQPPAPAADRHAGVRHRVDGAPVGDAVGHVGGALDRARVDAVLDVVRQRAGHDRRTGEPRLPGREPAVGVEPGLEPCPR